MYWRNFSTHNFIFLWSRITCRREIYSVNNIYLFHLIWKDQGEISVLLLPRTKKSNCKTLSWLIDVSFIEEIPLCNQERAEICLVDYFERPFFLFATGVSEWPKSWWDKPMWVKSSAKNGRGPDPTSHTFQQPCTIQACWSHGIPRFCQISKLNINQGGGGGDRLWPPQQNWPLWIFTPSYGSVYTNEHVANIPRQLGLEK